jgi:Kef-type K+ transport system membrane component KefB/mannitol/fructose-specific phosphotransferase system IIA component (Ntr-type)
MNALALPFTDPVLVFGTVMLLILLMPLAARKIGLPDIIGLLAAGILIGPHALGVLARDQSIQLLGKVGLLYIMFLAGLEIDLHQVRKNKSHTLLFGFVTFFVPLGMGTALGYFLFGMSLPVSILLASMFSSHTLLTFPAAGKLGLTRSRSVTTAVGGTILTDTLALIVLAVVIGSSRESLSALFWVRLFSLMFLYMGATMFLIPKIGRWAFRRMGSDEEQEFVFVMALTFIAGYLAHLAGLEPIIGAFLAGLSLNSLIPERSLLMTRLHFTGNTIFIPFFLISVGMLVNVRLLFSGPEVWIIIAGMSAVALLSKFISARFTALLLSYRPSEGNLLYGLSVNQAAATLAAVLVGYNFGLFDTGVITGTIMMIAVTCLTGSVVTQKAGKRVVLEEARAEYDESSAPHRVLIPLADRAGAREIIDLALLLRDEAGKEPVYPLRVVRESMHLERDLADAEKILAHSVVRAMSVNIPVTPLTSVDINEASGILRAVRDNRISLVLALWDGVRQAGSRTFGHTLDEVVDKSSQMVLISRVTRPVQTARRMVVLVPPYADRHAGFEKSIGFIKKLASQAGTGILMLGGSELSDISRRFITGSQPKVPVQFDTIPVWKRVTERLKEVLKDGDWIVLLSSRKGDISWQPSLDRLPGKLLSSCPSFNMSVHYPSSGGWDSRQAAETITVEHRLISGFTPERTLFGMDAGGVSDAVATLLAKYFGKRTANTRTVTAILDTISREEPVELASDVILLHTHLPFVDDSVIFMGVNKKPLKVPLASGGARIVIILLDPVDQDPGRHLKALADIARVIRLPGMTEALRRMKNFDTFSREVTARLEEEGR